MNKLSEDLYPCIISYITMNKLSEDLYPCIISYIGCECNTNCKCNCECNTNYSLISKLFYKKSKFIKKYKLKFKDLLICSKCDDLEMIDIINTFKKCGSTPNTIHFNTSKVLEKAMIYIPLYFGPISHKCCNDTGVMFKNCIKMEKYNDI